MKTIYAIGDIHGCYTELLNAEARILKDAARSDDPAFCVYLGDYVDKGPDSAAVIEHLSRSDTFPMQRVVLCGNHDDAFARCIEQPDNLANWLEFGAASTLRSYGIDAYHVRQRGGGDAALAAMIRQTVPDHHSEFLANMPVMLVAGAYVFVHAGIRPGVALHEQTDRDLMWIREPFLSKGPGLDVTVIHGHTPSREPVVQAGRIGIDTAAYATGHLTVLKIDGQEHSFL